MSHQERLRAGGDLRRINNVSRVSHVDLGEVLPSLSLDPEWMCTQVRGSFGARRGQGGRQRPPLNLVYSYAFLCLLPQS